MKTEITFLTLAALPWFGFAANVTGTWKAESDSQIGLQKYTHPYAPPYFVARCLRSIECEKLRATTDP
jgi:hypothetical protein